MAQVVVDTGGDAEVRGFCREEWALAGLQVEPGLCC